MELTEQEESRERLGYLVRASEVLGSSLDYEQTLEQLARLLVPDLADWCSVDVMDDPETIRNVAVAHVDPTKVQVAKELQIRYPPDPHAKVGVPAVVESGKSELFTEIPVSMIVEAAVDEEHLRMIRSLGGLRSAIVAPLSARGRRFGAITFVSGESGRVYDADDVLLAEQLGERAGLAIDNARLYRAERQASERLQLLAEMTELMSRSLDYEASLLQLAELAVQHVADFCIIDVVDDNGEITRIAARHRDPSRQPLADELRDRPPARTNAQHPVVRAIVTGEPQRGPITEELAEVFARDEDHRRASRDLHGAAYLCLPLIARARVLGALTLGSEVPYTDETVVVATEFAHRAAIAIDNARLYTDRARVADMLQRTLLPPRLPDIPGVEVAALFRAGGARSEVGGDFYDMFEVPGGEWAIVIGDVCGRGVEAAAATALARYGIRGGALRGEQPSEVLSMLNEEVLRSDIDRFCTVVYARLRIGNQGGGLVLARGGHPPPIVVRSSGEVHRLEPRGSLIGVFDSPEFENEAIDLGPADFVVFYTDGTTERGKNPRGEAEFVSLLGECGGLDAEGIVKRIDQAITGSGGEQLEDDVAVLVLRIEPRE